MKRSQVVLWCGMMWTLFGSNYCESNLEIWSAGNILGSVMHRLTMAIMMRIPNADNIRLMLRHHLAFSYRAASIGLNCFSRSSSNCVLGATFLPLTLRSADLGGRGRKEAINQALEQVSIIRSEQPPLFHLTWREYIADSEENDLNIPLVQRPPLRSFIHTWDNKKTSSPAKR